jgi:hypothetical protein
MVSSLRQLRAAVDRALTAGATLEELEPLIDGAEVPGDVRDALWLYAWGAAERREPVALGV